MGDNGGYWYRSVPIVQLQLVRVAQQEWVVMGVIGMEMSAVGQLQLVRVAQQAWVVMGVIGVKVSLIVQLQLVWVAQRELSIHMMQCITDHWIEGSSCH